MQTSSERAQRRASPRSRQRGAAGVFLIISLLLLVPILALALNIGQLYYAQRDLEKQATLAALSATQVASGCANDGRPGRLAAVTAEVIRIIAANNQGDAAGAAALLASGINDSPGVELGRIDVVGGLRRFVPLVDGNPTINAVRINLTRPQPAPFLRPLGAVFGTGNLYASATAQQAAIGTFSVGSGLLSLNGGIVNGLLGGLLCAPGDAACQGKIVSLNVVSGTQGLVNTQVSLGQLATALGVSVEDLSDPLTLAAQTPILSELLGGLVGALGDTASGSVVGLLQGLANAASNPREVPLGRLLGVVDGLGGDTPIINLFDLLIAAGQATVADPTGVTPINLPINLNVAGVANVATFINVLEPPQFGIGRPGQAEAKTAQVRLLVRIEAGGILNGLLGAINSLLNGLLSVLGSLVGLKTTVSVVPPPLNLGIDVQVAGGAATLERLQCPTSGRADPVAYLNARTATATVAVGTFSGAASSAPALNTATNSFPIATVGIDASCVGVKLGALCVGLNLGTTNVSVGLGLTGIGVGATSPAALAPVTSFTPVTLAGSRLQPVFIADGVPPQSPVAANPQTISAPTTVNISLNVTNKQTGTGLVGVLTGLVSNLLTGIVNLLNPLLSLVNGLTTALIDPLLSLLGIQLGTATVTMNAVQTGQPQLISTCLPGTALCP